MVTRFLFVMGAMMKGPDGDWMKWEDHEAKVTELLGVISSLTDVIGRLPATYCDGCRTESEEKRFEAYDCAMKVLDEEK